jgi:hypothetical protein
MLDVWSLEKEQTFRVAGQALRRLLFGCRNVWLSAIGRVYCEELHVTVVV